MFLMHSAFLFPFPIILAVAFNFGINTQINVDSGPLDAVQDNGSPSDEDHVKLSGEAVRNVSDYL